MKIATFTLVAAIALGGSASAQQNMGDMKGMDMGGKAGAGSSPDAKQTHTAKGTVKKADTKASTVTLAHEPIASLNWPAMTMNFRVKDKMLWSKLSEGKMVDVEFVKNGDDYVITAVR